MTITLSQKAEKALAGLKGEEKVKIISNFFELMNNPYLGKKLAGKYKACFSLRVWPFRVIYQIKDKEDEKIIYIIDIG